MRTAQIVRPGYLLLVLMAAHGCTGGDQPAGGQAQIEQGRSLYQAHCVGCHQDESGIGPRLKTAVLASRGTALRLYRYIRRTMPYQAGATLEVDEYWAITAYLLARSGHFDGAGPLDTETARAMELAPPAPSQ